MRECNLQIRSDCSECATLALSSDKILIYNKEAELVNTEVFRTTGFFELFVRPG